MLFHMSLPLTSIQSFSSFNPLRWVKLLHDLKHGKSHPLLYQGAKIGNLINYFQDNKHFTLVIDTQAQQRSHCTRLYITSLTNYLKEKA